MTTDPANAAAEAPPTEATTSGRGGLFVLVAKVYFIVTGFVQQALLPAAIGLAGYGALSRVLAVANVFNNVVVSSATQGVSRAVAGAGPAREQAFRAALRAQALLAAVAVALYLAATPLVVRMQRAEAIAVPLLIMGGVLALYGVYAPLVGYLNGRRQFGRQAALDITAATLRTVLLVGVGATLARRGGDLAGVTGAALGAVVAAAGVLALALRWTGLGAPAAGSDPRVPRFRSYVAGLVPVMLAQLFTNALMQADLLVVGRYTTISAFQSGLRDDPLHDANEWVAVYRACQLFAFLPYQMLFAVTQVLFPMLARAKAEDGEARVRELVRSGTRIGTILAGMLVAVIVTLAHPLLRSVYGVEVAARGATTLPILAIGQGAFALLGLAMTILISLGRERRAMTLTLVALASVLAIGLSTVPRAAFGEAQLLASATATTAGMLVALAAGALSARRATGAFIPGRTALRVGAAIAAASTVAFVARPVVAERASKITALVATSLFAVVVVVVYVVVLALTREIGAAELAQVRAVVARRQRQS